MLNKPLEEITKDDVLAFIEAGNSESRRLEYKRELRLGTDKEKKEFLYDFTAFANSAGGHILFGVSEETNEEDKNTGTPSSADGLSGFNVDTEQLRIENLLQSSITPRFSALQIRDVGGFPNGPVLIIRIPKSWNGPHMVDYGGKIQFYKRNSRGKYPMDYAEIKEAFSLAEELPEKIRNLRMERIGKISSGTIPVTLRGTPIFILHMFPLASFSLQTMLDPTSMSGLRDKLVSLAGSGGFSRFNVDGFLTTQADPGKESRGYCQLYRSGVIESVDTIFGRSGGDVGKEIDIEGLETNVLQRVREFFEVLSSLGIQPPVIVTLSILKARDYAMRPHNDTYDDEERSVDRDSLFLPEVILENFEIDIDRELRPLLDALWNAGNWSGSPLHDWNTAKRIGRI